MELTLFVLLATGFIIIPGPNVLAITAVGTDLSESQIVFNETSVKLQQ
jgi:threonine/homoserine/homoserine lactone efflux protein